MEQLFNQFVSNATVFQKGFFMMAAGVLFVFAVQMFFYLTVKIWISVKKRPKDQEV